MTMNPAYYLSLAAVISSAVVCIYLVLRPHTARREWPLVSAFLLVASIEFLDFLLVRTPENLLNIKPVVFVCEALLPLAWAVYANGLSGRNLFGRSVSNGLFWAGGVVLLVLSILPQSGTMIFSPDFGTELILFLGQPGFYFYLLLTIYLVAALVMLERSFSSMSRRDRWLMKLEVLGIGTILAMQIIYYSQGLLYRTLDMSLVMARATAVTFGLALFFYSRLRRGRPARLSLSLSRAAAFRSVVLLAVSGYLIFIGLVGEGLRYLGPSSNRAFFYSISLMAGVALCVLLLSDTLRRKTIVFLHKHFHRQKYDYRMLWMEMTDRLGAARDAETLSTAILEMFCQTFAVAGGALYLTRGKNELLLAAVHSSGQWPENLAPDGSLAEFLAGKQWVFNLMENADAISSGDAEQLQRQDIRFVVPLFFDCVLGGAIALGRQINVNEPIIYEDYDLLKILGRQGAAAIYNQRLSRQLVDHREMAAVGKVSAFVMHDLKNLVSNLSLVVENARELIGDSRFQSDMLETLNNTVRRMNGLIGRLKNVGEPEMLACEPCSLKQLVNETVVEIGSDAVQVFGADVEVLVDRGEIGKVITNLVRNSLEATNGTVDVQVEVGSNCGAQLVCRDAGCGMSEEFMADSLFRPFETTKQKGLGVGLYQCRQIVEAHGGRIEVASSVGHGSEFRVFLPFVEGNGGGDE